MPAGDGGSTPPPSARIPRITLVLEDDDRAPVDAVLRGWVLRLVRQHADHWPAVVSAGVRSPTHPWPGCWEEHPGLVARLRVLKRHHDDIAAGTANGDPFLAVYSWFDFLRNEIAVAAHIISGEICRSAHVPDPGLARPEPKREPAVAPPLPGQEQQPATVKPDTAPQRDPWAGFISGVRPPGGDTHERGPVER